MIKNSTLQKIINLKEEELNQKIIDKSKLEMLIKNINNSIDIINQSVDLESSKIKGDDLNMIKSFSEYRQICSMKIKFLQVELSLKEKALENIKIEIKEAYIEKEKFNLVLQKNLLKEKKQFEKQEILIVDEINLRNFVVNQGG